VKARTRRSPARLETRGGPLHPTVRGWRFPRRGSGRSLAPARGRRRDLPRPRGPRARARATSAGLYMGQNRFEWLQEPSMRSTVASARGSSRSTPTSGGASFDHVLVRVGPADPDLGPTRSSAARAGGTCSSSSFPSCATVLRASGAADHFPSLRTVVGVGDGPWPPAFSGWAEMVAGGHAMSGAGLEAAPRERRAPTTIALLMYTSGTNRAPEGGDAPPPQRRRAHPPRGARHPRAPATTNRFDHCRRRCSGASAARSTPSCRLQCGSMIAPPGAVRAASPFLKDIVGYDCNPISRAVPSQYEMALKHPDKPRIRPVATAAPSRSAARRRRRGSRARIVERRARRPRFISAYGLTEGVGVNHLYEAGRPARARDADRPAPRPGQRRPRSRTPDGGRTPCRPGEVGELVHPRGAET